MSEKTTIKNFLITGSYTHKGKQVKFKREFRAVKQEDAVEKIYLNLGSNHGVKRNLIKIADVKEISADEIQDKLVKEFATNKNISIGR